MSSVEPPSINDVAAPAAGYRLSREFVLDILGAAEIDNKGRVRELIEPLHVADIADLIDQVTPEQRQVVLGCLPAAIVPEILTELDESVRDEVLHVLAPQEVAEAVTELDTDDAVDLLEDLNADEQREVLAAVPVEERAAVEEGLGYAEDSAGRLMQRDFVAVPQYWNVGQIIDYLRDADDLPDEFFEIFVVDPGHHPVGTVPLSRAASCAGC